MLRELSDLRGAQLFTPGRCARGNEPNGAAPGEARRRADPGADGATLEEATARISEAIERLKAGDCGGSFEPDIVEVLRAVRHVDLAEFMRLGTAIKKANRDGEDRRT